MPEFYVRFDQTLPEDADDYLDVSPLIGPEFDERCAGLNLKSLLCWDESKNRNGDFSGISRREHEAMNALTPEPYRTEWSDDLDAWHDCADGVLWCDTMIAFVRDNPGPTEDQPSGLGIIMDELNDLHRKLTHGAKAMALFQVFHDVG